jgi:hypothetical protein
MRHLVAKLNDSVNAFTYIVLDKQRMLSENCRVDRRLGVAFDSLGLRVQAMAHVNVHEVVLKQIDNSIKREKRIKAAWFLKNTHSMRVS